MEQWMYALAAFGITAISIGGYIVVLRSRLKAAEAALESDQSDGAKRFGVR